MDDIKQTERIVFDLRRIIGHNAIMHPEQFENGNLRSEGQPKGRFNLAVKRNGVIDNALILFFRNTKCYKG